MNHLKLIQYDIKRTQKIGLKKSKDDYLLDLIIARMEIREIMKNRMLFNTRLRILYRQQKKMEQQNIKFILMGPAINKAKTDYKKQNDLLITFGAVVFSTLELWQQSGATLKDLCNLCNRNYEQVQSEISNYPDVADNLSKIVFVHNLDYPPSDKYGFIRDEVDAPFTHAVKEYMLDIMLHTPEGRKASDEALQNVFPELWESALIREVDEDGNVHFTDAEGNIIDTN